MIMRVSKFAKLYRAEYLEYLDSSPSEIRTHWFQAFRFFISRIIQGRHEQTTRVICQMIDDVLCNHLDCVNPSGITNIRTKDLHDSKQAFRDLTVDGRSYKKESDIDLLFGAEVKKRGYNTLGLLRYIAELPAGNIVQYSIDEIGKGRLIPHYRKLNSFYGVGSVAVSTYLRDLVDLYYNEIGNHVTSIEEIAHIQPVDASVKRVAMEAGIKFAREVDLYQGRNIVEECRRIGPSNRLPIEFSQGASWICSNSFEAALKLLSEKNLGDDLSEKFRK